MSNLRVELASKYLTPGQVGKALGLSREQLNLRIKRGVFPAPTLTSEGVRYFDKDWLAEAKAVLKAQGRP